MNAPAPANGPPRIVAVICNVGLVLMTAVSFGTCCKYGCQSNHISQDAGYGLALVSGLLGLFMTLVATVIFIMHLRKSSSATNILGLIASLGIGLASSLATPFFWIAAASSSGIGVMGGWGRPLRIGRRAVTPGVKASSEWAKGPRPIVNSLDEEVRGVLRDLWLHDARKEHASVPAFGQVAWQLVALGAPSDLVRRAHISCLQEIDHAERCFALASTYAGHDLGVQAMPALSVGTASLPKDRTRALVKVAIEALIDGALLEDYNAELARTALADVRDTAAREALVRIVHDEAEHAALAWDIIAFCLTEGGAPVANALSSTFSKFGDHAESLYDPDLVRRIDALSDKTPLYAHGRVRFEMAQPVFQSRKAAAAEKLATLLRTQEIERNRVAA